jgi:hypothetical protein
VIFIGIDTGTNTGYAVYNSATKLLSDLQTLPIHRAMFLVHELANTNIGNVRVYVEDARQVRFKTSPEKAQGAGYVKAHTQIWEAFLTDYSIPFEMLRPNKKTTKMDAGLFKRTTLWEGRTNTHSRDAAMIVWGR